jgi:hypothetical protein
MSKSYELSKKELEVIALGLQVGMFECQIPENDDPLVKGLIQKLGLQGKFEGYFPEEYRRAEMVRTAESWIDLWTNRKICENPHQFLVNCYNTALKGELPKNYHVQIGDPWACIFGSVVAIRAGYKELVPMECSCLRQMLLFKERGQWKQKGYTPKPGDYIYFDYNQDECPENVGVVVEVYQERDVVVTVEGNHDKTVKKVTYHMSNSGSFILGYGTPDYANKE